MGQYQQWLHHREAEQQLQIIQAALAQELNELEERVAMLEQAYSYADNPIIEALATSQQKRGQASQRSLEANEPSHAHTYPPTPETAATNGGTSEVSVEYGNGNHADADVMSPALLAWGNLPHFDAPTIPKHQKPDPLSPGVPSEQPLSPIPHSEMDLLPDDMAGFFDSHTRTEPQIELPWWLRNAAASSYANPASGPVDPESIRTNRLVQRWLERWRRQSDQSQYPQSRPGDEQA
jgi:hypothetical protein